MRTHRLFHRLALLSLLVVAAKSLFGALRNPFVTSVERMFAFLFGLAIWSLLLWKIWKRPRKWGFGVGIFLFLMIAFQSYLWWIGVNDPKLARLDIDRSVTNFILFYELPIFIAGVSSTLLRFYYPNEPSENTAKCA